jgi:hypothetical protein
MKSKKRGSKLRIVKQTVAHISNNELRVCPTTTELTAYI